MAIERTALTEAQELAFNRIAAMLPELTLAELREQDRGYTAYITMAEETFAGTRNPSHNEQATYNLYAALRDDVHIAVDAIHSLTRLALETQLALESTRRMTNSGTRRSHLPKPRQRGRRP